MLDSNVITELNFIDSKTSWQRRKAAMESIISCCERSAHYLEANKATGEVVKALKPRMNDTQANLKPIAVSAIAHIVASLDVEAAGAKVLRSMAAAMMIGLADNKKSMRDSTVSALQHAVSGQVPPPGATEGGETAAASYAPADSTMLMAVVPAAAESLANVVGRQELLAWLLHHVDAMRGDCSELVAPLVLTLQDKNAAVRSLGEQLMTALLAQSLASRAALDKATRDLPPATKRGMQVSIDRMMAAHGTAPPKVAAAAAGAADMGATTSAAAPAAPASPPRSAPAAAAAATVIKASPPRALVAPPLPPVANTPVHSSSTSSSASAAAPPVPASTAKKVTSSSSSNVSNTPAHHHSTTTAGGAAPLTVSANWLLKRNAIGKLRRAEEGAQRTNAWPQPPDEPGEMEVAALKVVWRPIVTPDLAFLLFPIIRPGSPVNQDVYVPAMNELSTQLTCPYLTHHTEFLLRWICIVLCLKQESGPGLLRLLQLICDLFEAIRYSEEASSNTINYMLSDAEVACILPHLVERCGHRSEKHQALFRHAISLIGEIVAPSKVVQVLTQGLRSHNKRSRVICLEELQRVVESSSGAAAPTVGPAAMREVVSYLDAKDCDLIGRNACLELIRAVYNAAGKGDAVKLRKLLGGGSDVSESTLSMIEDRLDLKVRPQKQQQPTTPTPAVSNTPKKTPAAAPAAVSVAVSPLVLDTAAVVASAAKAAQQQQEDNEEEKEEEELPSIQGKENADVWALTNSSIAAATTVQFDSPSTATAAAAVVMSPASEMRSHRMMLEQIDSVIASTPMPVNQGMTSQPNTARSGVSDADYESGSGSGEGADNAENIEEQQAAEVSTPVITISTAVASARSTGYRSHNEQEQLEEDTISALPSEFRSPIAAASTYKSSRLSLGISSSHGHSVGGDASSSATVRLICSLVYILLFFVYNK